MGDAIPNEEDKDVNEPEDDDVIEDEKPAAEEDEAPMTLEGDFPQCIKDGFRIDNFIQNVIDDECFASFLNAKNRNACFNNVISLWRARGDGSAACLLQWASYEGYGNTGKDADIRKALMDEGVFDKYVDIFEGKDNGPRISYASVFH